MGKIISDIRDYYIKRRGATNVYVKFLDDKAMAKTNLIFYDKAIEKPPNPMDDSYLLNHVQNVTYYDGKKNINLLNVVTKPIIDDDTRQRILWMKFHQNTRMLYMRHVVYKMALDKQQEQQQHNENISTPYYYDMFVSQREDSYFFEPIDYEQLLFDYKLANKLNNGDNPSSSNSSSDPQRIKKDDKVGKPYIFLENVCKFGAYSDKIHIGNQIAMTKLFGGTWKEFIHLTIQRLEYGHRTARSRPKINKYQTEAFFEHLLNSSSANIHEVDTKRVDTRYAMDSKDKKKKVVFCVSRTYYSCQSTFTKIKIKNDHNISVCS